MAHGASSGVNFWAFAAANQPRVRATTLHAGELWARPHTHDSLWERDVVDVQILGLRVRPPALDSRHKPG